DDEGGTCAEFVSLGKNVTIQGAGAGSTIFQGLNVFRGVTFTLLDTTLQGDGCNVDRARVTIIRSVIAGTNGPPAVAVDGGRVTVTDSTISGNSVTQQGGGIKLGGASSLTLLRSTVSGNGA